VLVGKGIMKRFKYVGPADLVELVKTIPKGKNINSFLDVLDWVTESEQSLANGEVVATYIIDTGCNLLVADRHSEHVACAGGEEVLSAGEITFKIDSGTVSVSEITNQSTGYCPEPSSWKAVNSAIRKMGIIYPSGFCRDFIFRKCENCGAINIVKEEWYVCAECDSDLPKNWNFG
jgi:hypothetical protein